MRDLRRRLDRIEKLLAKETEAGSEREYFYQYLSALAEGKDAGMRRPKYKMTLKELIEMIPDENRADGGV